MALFIFPIYLNLRFGISTANTHAVGPFRNGDAVLFNEKVLTAQVNFSLRTSFVFLPEDGFCFINKHTREEYLVDFFDPQAWIKYAWSPCSMYFLNPEILPLQHSRIVVPRAVYFFQRHI